MDKIRSRSKAALAPVMFAMMVLALGTSVGSLRAQGTPTCDGMHCHTDAHCGSKCICNPFHLTCLDNTPVEQ